MKIMEFVASRSIKVSLGNYESVDVFVSMKGQLDEFDDAGPKAFAELDRKVESAAFQQLVNVHVARGKAVVEAELTKRYGVRK